MDADVNYTGQIEGLVLRKWLVQNGLPLLSASVIYGNAIGVFRDGLFW